MDFKHFALDMYPFWILGISIMCAVMSTKYRYLLRINKKALIEWARFLLVVTSIRFLLFKLFPNCFIFNSIKGAATLIPIGVAFTVFWEDAVHGLPLLIFRNFVVVNKWTNRLYKLLMLLVMVEFGIGHAYQGILAMVALSFYIPYSIKIGEKYGFGTVMLGHMMYDACSMFFVKYLMGL